MVEAGPLRASRHTHGAVLLLWWLGRAEERGSFEDRAFRMIVYGRPVRTDMFACVPYVCKKSELVRIDSHDLILSPAICGNALGAQFSLLRIAKIFWFTP